MKIRFFAFGSVVSFIGMISKLPVAITDCALGSCVVLTSQPVNAWGGSRSAQSTRPSWFAAAMPESRGGGNQRDRTRHCVVIDIEPHADDRLTASGEIVACSRIVVRQEPRDHGRLRVAK